jgi:hypothetical protein
MVFLNSLTSLAVMPGLVPGISLRRGAVPTIEMAGTSPAMTS